MSESAASPPASTRPSSSKSSTPPPSSNSTQSTPRKSLPSPAPLARPAVVWRKRAPLSFSLFPPCTSPFLTADGQRLLERVVGEKEPVRARVDTGERARRAASRTKAAAEKGKSRPSASAAERDGSSGSGGSVDDYGWGRWVEDDDDDDDEDTDDRLCRPQPQQSAAASLAASQRQRAPPQSSAIPPAPRPPRPPASPLLSVSLLSLTMQFVSAFHLSSSDASSRSNPVTSLPPSCYLHLRLLTFRASLLSASYAHLSLRSLCLLCHLDLLEDSAGCPSLPLPLPVFHRSLLFWAMTALDIDEAGAGDGSAVEVWLRRMWEEVTVEAGEQDEAKDAPFDSGPASRQRHYPSLTAADVATLSELTESARAQWDKATADHDRRAAAAAAKAAQPAAMPAPPPPLPSPPPAQSFGVTAVTSPPLNVVPSSPSSWSRVVLSSSSSSSPVNFAAQTLAPSSSLRRYLTGTEIREMARVEGSRRGVRTASLKLDKAGGEGDRAAGVAGGREAAGGRSRARTLPAASSVAVAVPRADWSSFSLQILPLSRALSALPALQRRKG